MLSDTLRDGANSKGFKLLLAIIVISFVLTGVGGYLIPRLNTDPVTIGDYKITSSEWTEQYNRRAQELHRYGPEAASMLENPQYVSKLKQNVLEGMIDNVAFNSNVWEMNVRIGDAQVRDVIRNTPAFQKDGKFNNELYLAAVRNMGMTPDYFGEQLRVSIMSESVSRPLMNVSSQPLPYEIRNIAALLAQHRIVSLYTVDSKAVADKISATEAEAGQYYKDHNNEFMAPATVRFNYLLLSLDDLKKEVEVTDTKLEEFYNLYSDDFALPEQRRAAHLIIRKDSKDAAKRIAAVEKGIADGTPFAELVKKYSDDSATKDQGGDMGLMTRGQMAANLDSALFSLNEGQISAKIEDAFGTHFIALTEIVAPHTPTLEEAKDKVTEAFITAQARDLFNERIATMSDLSFENPDSLDLTAEKVKLEVKDSGVVNQGDFTAPWPFNSAELQKLAFNPDVYTSGVNSNVISLDDNNAIVINVIDHHDAALRNFDEVKDQALTAVTQKKIKDESNRILTTYANELKSNAIAPLPEFVSIQKSVDISAGSSAVSPQFSQAIFAMPREGERNSIISDNNGVETLAVLEKVVEGDEATLSGFEKVLAAQYGQYLSQNTQASLYRQARSLSKIEYNQEAIDLVTKQNDME